MHLRWYLELDRPAVRVQFQWKYADEDSGSIFLRSASQTNLCVYPTGGKSDIEGNNYIYHDDIVACNSPDAMMAVSCTNESPWFTSTATSTTETTATSTTTTTTTTTTNTVEGEIGRQQQRFTDVEALLESQIDATDKHVVALSADIAALKQVNEAQTAQITTLLAAIEKLAGDDNAPKPNPSPECDTGASVWDVPTVESDGDGGMHINACFGKITLRSSMCAVDPCVLNDRIAALEKKLAAVGDP